jgi:hypothetical protein
VLLVAQSAPIAARATGIHGEAEALDDEREAPLGELGRQVPRVRDDVDGVLAVGVVAPARAAANAEALARMTAAEATLVDVVPAADALGLERGTFLHAGPPIEWERASGPLKGALIGAVLFEGLAETPEDAERALARGDFAWEPCHHRDAVGPMAGVVSPSMWMYELADDVHGNRSWCSLNEGLGKVLRYGAYGQEVIDRLHWMNSVLGPILQQSVRASGPFDIKAILTQMLQMGDEGHNRNRAGSLMLLRELLPGMITADAVGGERFWEILASSGQVGQIGHFSGGFWDEPFPQPRLGEAGFRFLVDSPLDRSAAGAPYLSAAK